MQRERLVGVKSCDGGVEVALEPRSERSDDPVDTDGFSPVIGSKSVSIWGNSGGTADFLIRPEQKMLGAIFFAPK